MHASNDRISGRYGSFRRPQFGRAGRAMRNCVPSPTALVADIVPS